MTDLTAASVTTIGGANPPSGRSSDRWGAREIGLYRVTLTNSAPAGGFTFDPNTYGFQGVVGAVFIQKHILVGSIAVGRYQYVYDYVNRKILPLDSTDSFDDGSGDDMSLVILDLLVVSE